MDDVLIDDSNRRHLEISEFRDNLKGCIVQRFSGKANLRQGQKRKVFTFDVFHNEAHILASLLDPRVKHIPFQSKIS
jgi:hypothetical protein